MVECLSRLITQYPKSHYLPAYLSLSGSSYLHGWSPMDRSKVIDQALQADLPQTQQQLLALKWIDVLDMLLDPHIESASRKAGLLIDHWSVVGPFGRFGSADSFHAHGPEKGFQSEYQGWQKTVQWKTMDQIDGAGLVDLGSLVYPNTGIAYAVNVVESEIDTQARLTIYSSSNIQVWWNAQPILEKSSYLLDYKKITHITVPVSKGKNLLTIKSQFTNQGWWVRSALQSLTNEALQCKSVPFDADDWSSTYLVPFEVKLSREQNQQYHSTYPLPVAELSETYQKVIHNLFLATWYREQIDYGMTQKYLSDTIALAPNFALAYYYRGKTALNQASIRPGSKARFHQVAETSFQKALELDPRSKSALIGLQGYFLDRNQIDQALILLNQQVQAYPEILTEGYTNAIHYAYGILYMKKQFTADAASSFQKSLQSFIPSYELYNYLFDYYRRYGNRQKQQELIRFAIDYFPGYFPFLNRASEMNIDDDWNTYVLNRIEAGLRIHPYSVSFIKAKIDLLQRTGNFSATRDYIKQVQAIFPDPSILLEREASLAFLMGEEEDAIDLYKESFQKNPIKMTPFRVLRDVDGRSDFEYQKYDVQLEDVDISKADQWNNSRASSIYLLDIMVLKVYEDGTFDQYVHQAIKIMNQEGMEKWAEIVTPSGGNVELILAKTIARDGTEWDISNLQDLSGQQSLSMYGIEPGAILEFAYLQRSGRPDPGMHNNQGGYFFGSEDDPMLLSKITIVRPVNRPFHMDRQPNEFQPVKIVQEGDTVIEIWEKWMSEGIKKESFSPALARRVPSIQWSSTPDWQHYIEQWRHSVWGFEESSDEIDQVVKQLKSESSTKIEYVENVYHWIRETIEDSTGGRTTVDTVSLKAGGQFQKIRLARQLLHLGDIQTYLVQALDHKKSDGFHPMPSLNYPSNTLLIIPKQPGVPYRCWIDFSSRYAPFNRIHPSLRTYVALNYDTSAPYFEPVDHTLWKHGLLDRKISLNLQEDGSANVTGKIVYDHLFDQEIREVLTNPVVEKQLVDAQLARDLRGIRTDEYAIVDLDDLSKSPYLTFSGHLPDVAKPDTENVLRISPVLVRSQASAFVNEPTRQFEMAFETSPVWHSCDVRINMSHYLQKKARIQLPEPVLLITEFGFYSLYYCWQGDEIIGRQSFLMPPQEIQPENYERFVDFCRTIDQVEDQDIYVLFSGS
jgi:tetratricopeptide (TPR) repeat protein